MVYQKFNTKLLLSLLPIGLLSAGAQAGSAVINAQKQQTKPQFSIGFTGSMHFGLRVLDTGLKNVSDWGTTSAFDDSMPQNDASSVIDIGTYSNKPLIIGIQADVNYEKFSAGASVELSAYDEIASGLALRNKDVTNQLQLNTSEPHIAPKAVQLYSAEIHFSERDIGGMTLGLAPTMSASAADITYFKQASDIGVDYFAVHYPDVSGVPSTTSGWARFVESASLTDWL